MLTNEERGLDIYATTNAPTIPSSVTPDTPLEALNLNWREADLPERLRTRHVHRLHPYLGKFIPQLVEVFLRKYFRPGQTVGDPFAGSGTTLVQANELGIGAFGCDLSAFNVLLARVKTARYRIETVEKETYDALEKTRRAAASHDPQLPLFGEPSELRLPVVTQDYLTQWFAPQALNQLLTYREAIERGDYEYPDVLRVILSRSARSARLTTHFDLDFPKQPQTGPYWCYKHSRECQPTTDALKFLRRYSADTAKRLKEFASVRTDADVAVVHGNSSVIEYPRMDGIITSPPYVGLIDYHGQHAYSYHLLGIDDHSEQEIGPASSGSGQRAKQQYQADIARVLRRALSAMSSGGVLIVVANDRWDLYGDIAADVGVETEAVVKRHVNRRTGRRSGAYFESVFIWRKP
ncbi:site-specific DNA-methyltransferase [Candidatus Poribacteria bacterium]|nr:site-specific DNA-methyltransferase [Candidatus Poribacteria bacterium]